MGLAASQSRLLSLTSRMHDLEYKGQKLEAQKLEMANKSQDVYNEYETALNKTKFQVKTVGSDGSNNYVNVTSANLANANYAYEVVGSKKVYKTLNNAADAAYTQATGNTDGASNFDTADKQTAAITDLVSAGIIVLVKMSSQTTYNAIDDTAGSDIDTLVNAGSATESNIGTDTNLQEVSDDTNTKKAEAKYEADLAKIDAKDKKFDTDIASIDNQRNAIKTEIDTLKTVAKDNIERTFKLFG